MRSKGWMLAAIMFALLIFGRQSVGSENADPLAPIAPFVDDSTVLVVHVDVQGINLNALQTWVTGVMQKAGAPPQQLADELAQMPQQMAAAQAWIDDFQKAGGRHVYVLASSDSANAPVVVIPVDKAADRKTIVKQVRQLDMFSFADEDSPPAAPGDAPPTQPGEDNYTLHSRQIGSSLVFATSATLEKLSKLKPAVRAEFAQGMSAVDSPTASAVFAPNAAIRKLADQDQNPFMFIGITKEQLESIRWISVGIKPPPQPVFSLKLQASKADAAKELLAALQKQMAAMAAIPGTARIAALLTPVQKEDQLVLTLKSEQLEELAISTVRMQAIVAGPPAPAATQPADNPEPQAK